MLKTIKFPKNLKNLHRLAERLPHQNYQKINFKKVDLNEFIEDLNNLLINKEKNNDKTSDISKVHSFPKLQENQIISKNADLLMAKNGNKIKYIEYIKKPNLNKKKSVSPVKRSRYANIKPGRDFLLEPLSIKNDTIESGRQLFGKNHYHEDKQEESEIVKNVKIF